MPRSYAAAIGIGPLHAYLQDRRQNPIAPRRHLRHGTSERFARNFFMAQTAVMEPTATQKGLSQLDQLKRFTKVVADTGDFGTLKQYSPQDATTNPSLILKAAQMPEYKDLVDRVIGDARKTGGSGDAVVSQMMDAL